METRLKKLNIASPLFMTFAVNFNAEAVEANVSTRSWEEDSCDKTYIIVSLIAWYLLSSVKAA